MPVSLRGVVAYSPTTEDRQGREGEWVTIKLWGSRSRAKQQCRHSISETGNSMAVEGLVGVVPGFQDPVG